MNPAPKLDLLDGKLRIAIGGYVLLEDEWNALRSSAAA